MQLSEFIRLMLEQTNEEFKKEVEMRKLIDRILSDKEDTDKEIVQ